MTYIWSYIKEFHLDSLSAPVLLGVALVGLMLASQVVVLVLDQLEKKRFSSVLLGTMITPMCTGFPNLVIGLFGQERFQGDLVLKLNIGNNLANMSLVVGLLIVLAGPLNVRPEKGKSKRARKANKDQAIVFVFLWIGAILCTFVCVDGNISRLDGVALVGVYMLYQFIAFKRRGKVPRKFKISGVHILGLLLLLGVATWIIQTSLDALALAMERTETSMSGDYLGLILGLLTVIPESFLMLRLAFKKGNLGLNGLLGDCMVSIPLVVGLSSILHPISTSPISHWSQDSIKPFLGLGLAMVAVSILATSRKPVSRKMGIVFVLIYAVVWIFVPELPNGG